MICRRELRLPTPGFSRFAARLKKSWGDRRPGADTISSIDHTTIGREEPGPWQAMPLHPSRSTSHALFRTGTAIGMSDASLLERFRSGAADEAEAAFAVLVERHGPMVLLVCRRILGDRHDAEDAAQAVSWCSLSRRVRSAGPIRSQAGFMGLPRGSRRARLDAARRRLREREGAERSMAIRDVDHAVKQDGSETWAKLYEELARLPERFRVPIVLCHLEGLTYEQAAERLGCPVRTIQSRLSRGRARLRAG